MIKKGERFYIATGSYSDFGYIAAVEALHDFDPVEFIQPYADSFKVIRGVYPHTYINESAVLAAAEKAGVVRELERDELVGQKYLYIDASPYVSWDVEVSQRLEYCVDDGKCSYNGRDRIPLRGLKEECELQDKEMRESRYLEKKLLESIQRNESIAYKPSMNLDNEIIVMVKPLTEDPLESLRNDPSVKKKVLIDG